MKKFITTFVFTLVLLNPWLVSQAQNWEWVNPYPTGSIITATCFLDDQNGFVIGEYGTLLRTTNRGETWETVNLGSVSCNFIKISFSDPLNGRVLGSDPNYGYSYFFSTTDGGQNWTQHTITSFYISFIDMIFINSQYGWCLGSDNKLFKTTDGGLNWFDKSLTNAPDMSFSNILFKNENEGYMFGYKYSSMYISAIAHTTNGGDSWTFNFLPYLGGIFCPSLPDDSIAVLANNSGWLLRSTDNCSTWTLRTGNPVSAFNSIDFLDSQNGILGADSGNVFLTSNGGISWNKKSTGFQTYITSIQYLTQDFLSAAGHLDYSQGISYILTSTDHGNSWVNHTRSIGSQLNIYAIEPVDSLTAFICGGEYYYDGYIYKTTDKGLTWQQVCSSTYSLYDIKALNENVIFACGGNYNNSVILKSTNGGVTWTTTTFNTYSSMQELSLPDSAALYAINDSYVYKSTNLGASWNVIYQPSSAAFSDMEFTSALDGYISGGYSSPGQLYKTTDGGSSWTTHTISSYDYIGSINFPSNNTGYACSYSYIYKTIDGGLSWNLLNSSIYSSRDIAFNDEQNGWMAGDAGIYKTSDGGQNWIQETQQQYYSFSTFGMKRGVNLWVIGPNGFIMKYKGELPSPVAISGDNGLNLPKEFALLQNYPNPFNPTTKIRYDVPKQSNVVLKIYDVLGAEVATLINQNMMPGRYTAEWNASRFASGMYIYRMEAEGYTASKKLMLVK